MQDSYVPVPIEEAITALKEQIKERKRREKLRIPVCRHTLIEIKDSIELEMKNVINRWFDRQLISQKTTPAVKKALRKVFKKVLEVKYLRRGCELNIQRLIREFEKTVAKSNN